MSERRENEEDFLSASKQTSCEGPFLWASNIASLFTFLSGPCLLSYFLRVFRKRHGSSFNIFVEFILPDLFRGIARLGCV